MEEKQKERKLRNELSKVGLQLRKSKIKMPNADNFGGYQIIDTNTNAIVLGSKFELEIEDIEKYLSN